MNAFILISRDVAKKRESTAMKIVKDILQDESLTHIWFTDNPDKLNRMVAFEASYFAKRMITIVTIDAPNRSRFLITNTSQPVLYKQYPHANPLPRQGTGSDWRGVFASRDKWIIGQVLEPQATLDDPKPRAGKCYFLAHGNDKEVLEAYHYARDYVVSSAISGLSAGELELVEYFDIQQVHEDSQPKQLGLF